MRNVRHWTGRYVVDRARQALYARQYPQAPWLTPQATRILTTMLLSSDHGLEFGSGRSTAWFARRVRHLTSVEHDEAWYASTARRLKEENLDNVNYLLAPRDVPDDRGAESEYVTTALRIPEQSLQFALVDGIYRDHCAEIAIPRLESGGLLIVDNVNWVLPSQSRSPASRRAAQGPDGPGWAGTLQTVRNWRTVWTSNGVWDTAIFIKP